MERRTRGITLIELLITITVVGIIAAFAYPSYLESVHKARRADAQGALTGLAQAMERWFTEHGTYLDGASPPPLTGADRIYPDKAPIDGSRKYYQLSFDSDNNDCTDGLRTTATTYCVLATPIAGAAQDGDGMMSLSSTGARGWDRNNDGDTTDPGEDCWDMNC